MKKLLKNLDNKISKEIEERLISFIELNKKDNLEWFSELCFCILTANSKAETAIKIQSKISPAGFIEYTQTNLSSIIRSHGHRFHNTKARYIFLARKFINIKDLIQNLDTKSARLFLIQNIKGLGYKESSHFLRNVGYHDVAIIDRHILKFLYQNGLIPNIPKTITPKKYLECEEILKKFNIPLDKLDLMIWAQMTGKVLK